MTGWSSPPRRDPGVRLARVVAWGIGAGFLGGGLGCAIVLTAARMLGFL